MTNHWRSWGVGALVLCWSVPLAPSALADPEPPVPCQALNAIRGSLSDDIGAGIDGVRRVIGSPYLVGSSQKRDADVQLAMVSHGAHYLQDINRITPVPGLAPLLDNMNSASDDMSTAVDALFQLSGGGLDYGPTMSLAWPQPSTWSTIDYAEQKKDDIGALVNTLQGRCTP